MNRASQQNPFQENVHEKISYLLSNFVRASGPEWPSHKTRILSTTATRSVAAFVLLKDEDIRKLYTPGTKRKTFPLDERKSIFVTDQAILDLFTFDELMERLASHRAPHKISKEQLFRQWWDTANPKTEFNRSFGGRNCTLGGQLNNFPYTCPRNEGEAALQFPFGPPTDATYTAIALSNRFNLTIASEKGGHRLWRVLHRL